MRPARAGEYGGRGRWRGAQRPTSGVMSTFQPCRDYRQIGFSDVARLERVLDSVVRLELRFLASEWLREHGIVAADDDPPGTEAEDTKCPR